MIVLFGGTKGGTSKSTLTVNMAALLATAGKDVVILDTDPQATSAKWCGRRAENERLAKVHCVQKAGDVRHTATDLNTRYEYVLIDAGGADSKELRTAMLTADRLYVPLSVSQFDLETLESLVGTIDQAKEINENLNVYAILSKAPTNPVINEIAEARELLADVPYITLCDTIIRERKVHRDVIRDGRAIIESSNQLAIAEIESLGKEIFNV